MRTIIASAVFLSLLGLSAIAKAADANQASVQFGPQSFHWREFGDTGGRLLQEQGARFSVGAAFDNFRREDAGVLYSVNGKLYLGSIDYDGQTQSGTPATTDVSYFGLNIELQGGYRIGRRIGLDVFGALGFDDWIRSIADGRAANGTTVYGYEEYYTILYGKAGLGFFQRLDGWRYFLQGGVKMPLSTSEHVDLGSGVDLQPGLKPSAFANFQFDFGSGRHNRFGAALYYDSYRFSKSDPELLTEGGITYQVWQPRSHMDVYGLRLSYYFL